MVADALSRRTPVRNMDTNKSSSHLNTVLSGLIQPFWEGEVKRSYEHDELATKLLQ